MKYFVRTTGERKLDSSYSQIEYELLIDHNHNAGKAFADWLEKYFINQDCVILEDDLILCKDFKNRIEKVIEQYPNEMINFYEEGLHYFPIHKQLHFQQNQCTYYPKEISKLILNTIKDNHIETSSCSELIRTTTRILNLKHLIYRPIFVQHLDYDSLMNHFTGHRRSIYFIDYLEELNISYEEASKEENKIKLIDLMNKKFKEREGK